LYTEQAEETQALQENKNRVAWQTYPVLYFDSSGGVNIPTIFYRHGWRLFHAVAMGLSKNFSFWTVSLDLDTMFKIKSLLYKDLILNERSASGVVDFNIGNCPKSCIYL